MQDLEAYQLAVQVRRRIFRLTKREPAASDFKFVDQIRDAARGGSRNISEGFSRFAPKGFRQYLEYARSSLNEVTDELEDALDSEYVTEAEHDELRALLERTNGAVATATGKGHWGAVITAPQITTQFHNDELLKEITLELSPRVVGGCEVV